MDDALPGENIPYLTALGRFTERWSMAEVALDLCNITLFYRAGGKTLNPDLPRALERKVAFFRLCHNKLDSISLLGAKGLAIADEFSRLRDDRHTLIHGSANSADDEGKFSIDRLRILQDDLRMESRPFSVDKIAELNIQTFALAKLTLAHSAVLIKTVIPPDELDEMLSKMPG